MEEVSEACSDEECSVRVVIDDEEDRDGESEDLKVGHHSDRDVTGFRKLLLLAQTARAAQASQCWRQRRSVVAKTLALRSHKHDV